MQRVQMTAIGALQRVLANQPPTPAKVAFAWTMAAGPTLARAGSTDWSVEGTLRVRARDAAWLREIRHARPIIQQRLTQLLGAGVVRRLVIE